MATVEEQLKNINNKDDMIKLLVNAYYFHSHKLDNCLDKVIDEVSISERQQVKAKADEIMGGKQYDKKS